MLCQSVIQTIDSFRRGYDAGIRWGGSAYQPAKLHSCGKSTHPAFRQVPRSFAPARTSRQSGQAPSARPSVTGNDIEEPQLNANATASANVADNGRRTPPSFSPKPDAPLAARLRMPPHRAAFRRRERGCLPAHPATPCAIRRICRFPGPHRQQQTCPRSSAILAGRRRQRRKR